MMSMQARPFIAAAIGITAFVAAPVAFYAVSDAPIRSVLKDAISIITLLAFAMMLAQFFFTRCNTLLLDIFKPPLVQKVHKCIAYGAITVILLHPVLIVVPRYFEGGVTPWSALVEILSNFTNIGILTGIIAWLVLVCLGLTAFFRKPMLKRMAGRYRSWRGFHALVVLALALLHEACGFEFDPFRCGPFVSDHVSLIYVDEQDAGP